MIRTLQSLPADATHWSSRGMARASRLSVSTVQRIRRVFGLQPDQPRRHVHLTPTSVSWINQVERFFALLTDKQIRLGVLRSVAALNGAIRAFLDQKNANPSRSAGPNPPTISSPASSASVCETQPRPA